MTQGYAESKTLDGGICFITLRLVMRSHLPGNIQRFGIGSIEENNISEL